MAGWQIVVKKSKATKDPNNSITTKQIKQK